MAQCLHNAGIMQNDMISIVAENRHEFMAITCGAFYLNAILAPLNNTYTKRKSIKRAYQASDKSDYF
jgi:acyl-CoA synthetase (AMP-forming)/AMP-acid ligase II